jgi:restriction endonuclease
MSNKNLNMEERISDLKDSAKENVKSKNIQAQNIQNIWDTMKRSNIARTATKEEEIQVKVTENIFNKFIKVFSQSVKDITRKPTE